MTKDPQKTKKAGKSAKAGRHKASGQRYMLSHAYEINKCRRLRKALKRNHTDANALTALRVCAQALSGRQHEALGIQEYLA
jgi:urease gamma subunit